YKVGLYTSPHLVRLGERVQVNREILTESEIMAYTRELLPVAARLGQVSADDHPSFFEFMTAMAFWQFARKGCDVAVAEVGLGGELDATNIVEPAVTAITSIGFDHCEILGHTHAEIAQAKAGIIKSGVPIVIGRMPLEAEDVIRKRAAALEAPVSSVRDRYGEELGNYPETALVGDCQRWNAATASLVIEALGWSIESNAVEIGLQAAHWPARWERMRIHGRTVIMDASHNPEGAAELRLNLARLHDQTGKNPIVVVGALGLARAQPLIEAVAEFAQEIHIVVPEQSRACGFADIRNLIPDQFAGAIHESEVKALFEGQRISTWSNPEDTVVVTGSIYLAGEVMGYLRSQQAEIESHLQDF
ncbi:MAG: bifunctional folylpolyglutamate synthase/dihydrofolate synthase, partial [Opitutaceae bacterium]|nr:bifunctional folylpolyglutamate synthase/dihydrofolate synthase [Opitutaceae bacterium]